MSAASAVARGVPLALTMGDPAGIGLEIAIRAWTVRKARQLPPFCLVADPDALAERGQLLGLHAPVGLVSRLSEAASTFETQIPVLPVALAAKCVAGRSQPANAKAVIGAIETAVELVESGEAAAVVTNPIHKATLASAGFQHPGHTEFLGALAERHHKGSSFKPVMMLAADELRVVPLTVHIPLARVPDSLTRPHIVETARITADALQRYFAIAHPRIAIAGLNPHAGESGTMGREEIDIIAPAVAELQAEGLAVLGPFPADTMFHAQARRGYDAAIAMYHDQALIPIKTLAFDRGVNVTLGLPFVRTSPDHGTAFDIAAKGVANPESLIQALLIADRMAGARANRAASGAKHRT